jgi:hypothetical protein
MPERVAIESSEGIISKEIIKLIDTTITGIIPEAVTVSSMTVETTAMVSISRGLVVPSSTSREKETLDSTITGVKARVPLDVHIIAVAPLVN